MHMTGNFSFKQKVGLELEMARNLFHASIRERHSWVAEMGYF